MRGFQDGVSSWIITPIGGMDWSLVYSPLYVSSLHVLYLFLDGLFLAMVWVGAILERVYDGVSAWIITPMGGMDWSLFTSPLCVFFTYHFILFTFFERKIRYILVKISINIMIFLW